MGIVALSEISGSRLPAPDSRLIIGCQTDDALCARQHVLWFDPFWRGTFKPGHIAVTVICNPFLELFATQRCLGTGKAAIVKTQFPRLSSNGILHHCPDCANLN